MDELTQLIKKEIKRQYRSVRQFSLAIGVPQSTIVTALQKGIGGTSFSTIMTICKVLGIKPVLGEQGIFLDRESRQLLERYMLLDERGRQTVLALTEVEVLRATADPLYDNLLKRADEVAQPKA
ncbi:MAG: transcriptional regulator [Clostridia bacterium]|nr:transcriptional regulator [Oscillospiraceae bacterium]MBQ5985665.1 transcriptional regulator [Clostridia bacterium]MBR3270341.1 transcriptional regulator [Clostridia bacterium]